MKVYAARWSPPNDGDHLNYLRRVGIGEIREVSDQIEIYPDPGFNVEYFYKRYLTEDIKDRVALILLPTDVNINIADFKITPQTTINDLVKFFHLKKIIGSIEDPFGSPGELPFLLFPKKHEELKDVGESVNSGCCGTKSGTWGSVFWAIPNKWPDKTLCVIAGYFRGCDIGSFCSGKQADLNGALL